MSGSQDLADFISFGIGGGAISESDRGAITENWNAMRAAVPGWIWDTVDELSAKIGSGGRPSYLVVGARIRLTKSEPTIQTNDRPLI